LFAGFSGLFVDQLQRHEKRGEPALSLGFIGGGPNPLRPTLTMMFAVSGRAVAA